MSETPKNADVICEEPLINHYIKEKGLSTAPEDVCQEGAGGHEDELVPGARVPGLSGLGNRYALYIYH